MTTASVTALASIALKVVRSLQSILVLISRLAQWSGSLECALGIQLMAVSVICLKVFEGQPTNDG
jgi:hypothetical protein